MASRKKSFIKVRLRSTKSGYFYVTKKNTKFPKKLECMKYDPTVREHVLFKETKI